MSVYPKSPFDPDSGMTGPVFLKPLVSDQPQAPILFRHRLVLAIFFLAQFPAIFASGIARPLNDPHFDWLLYTYVAWVFPGVISAVILLLSWVLNPSPRRY